MAGVSVSKANAYAVLAPLSGVSISKAVAYAVLAPPSASTITVTTSASVNVAEPQARPLVVCIG